MLILSGILYINSTDMGLSKHDCDLHIVKFWHMKKKRKERKKKEKNNKNQVEPRKLHKLICHTLTKWPH